MSYGSYQIVVGRVSNIRRAGSRGWMKFSFGDPPVDIHMAKDGRPGFNNGEPIAVANRGKCPGRSAISRSWKRVPDRVFCSR
jgi:hypothetical protein